MLAAAGATVTFPEVIAGKLPLPKLRVMVSALLYDKLAKAATPFIAVTLVVPCRAAVPAFRVTVTTVLLSLVTRLPNESRSWTAGTGEKVTPAVAVAGGWVWITRLAVGDELTVNTELAALLRPLALAANCLFAPAASIRRFVNDTVPLPAPLPMSRLVVPWSGPVPAAKLTVTFKLAGKPTIELFPKAS